MDLTRMLRAVRKTVQGALPALHGHMENTLTEATAAMLLAAHCQLSRLALVGVGRARAPSRERRWQRLVANSRLTMKRALNSWARWVLADAREATLILDETPQGNRLRVMKLARQIRGRAVPLLWHCYRPDALPMSQDRVVLDLLRRVARALPGAGQVTLLADRGLSWPAVLDFCAQHRWHYILRVQGQTRVRLPDGRQVRADALTPRAGTRWCGAAWVFKKAGWRACNVVAHWPAGHEQPWLLITDLPANGYRCRQYRKRSASRRASGTRRLTASSGIKAASVVPSTLRACCWSWPWPWRWRSGWACCSSRPASATAWSAVTAALTVSFNWVCATSNASSTPMGHLFANRCRDLSTASGGVRLPRIRSRVESPKSIPIP